MKFKIKNNKFPGKFLYIFQPSEILYARGDSLFPSTHPPFLPVFRKFISNTIIILESFEKEEEEKKEVSRSMRGKKKFSLVATITLRRYYRAEEECKNRFPSCLRLDFCFIYSRWGLNGSRRTADGLRKIKKKFFYCFLCRKVFFFYFLKNDPVNQSCGFFKKNGKIGTADS